ncbi:MarR family transcriptional regulator [Paenibacillus mucilaginosus 3016]|uniref:MarR family transcriptional regulator n=1 Tax=Paenibacillus mucilaginosus 3016 TaxID=1116391 RepID=H6NAA2_9BACL|nr:MarR family transcriptional regulator [Paenibacillus mucilaginosus]AFC29348.1 MarR family transcriptional regulator [Paenibacillus mucilaginosus 3016]
MENNRSAPTGSHHLGRLFLQLQRLERKPRIFGDAGPLTPSEIHTIDAIGMDGTLLMSELAARLGVTKGAVTQIFSRLEAKELVIRAPHPEDSRAVLVSLTDKGRSAYRAHEEVHRQFYEELSTELGEEEIRIFEQCIQKLIRFMEE